MVIIGMAALPIMLLISQSLDQLTRANDANERASAMQSALAILDPINPMETPNGKISLDSHSFTWTSEAIVPPNDGVQIGAGLAGYLVGFYDVQIDMYKVDQPWFTFSLRKVGYEKIEGDGPPGISGL